jgi:hypothetical protein
MDIDLKSTHYTEDFPVAPLTIKPLTLTPVTITPVAVHLKELNQIAPLSVESLRVDQVRHVDPLQIDQLNITSLPSVSLSMNRMPALDINVARVPPVAVAIQQQFEMCSDYAITARILGLPLVRLALTGRTVITPKDCARREQSSSHERSARDVAALGNPAIPSRAIPTGVQGCAPPPAARRPAAPQMKRRPPVRAGAPRFGFSLQHPARAPAGADNAINGG